MNYGVAARAFPRASRCRYLLFQLYKRMPARREQTIRLLDGLLRLDTRVDGVPSRAELLDEGAAAVRGSEAGRWLMQAAEMHSAAADGAAELRVLGRAMHHLTTAPQALAVLDRVDALSVRGFGTDVERAEIQTTAAWLLVHLGHYDQALPLFDRAATGLQAASDPVTRRRALSGRAHALLGAGQWAEAETQARELLAESEQWDQLVVVAKALLAQGRDEEADAFLAEHGMDREDVSDED